jgi:hypothetical protein
VCQERKPLTEDLKDVGYFLKPSGEKEVSKVADKKESNVSKPGIGTF